MVRVFTPDEISNLIWEEKYRFEWEKSWADTVGRVMGGPNEDLMFYKKFLPAGRIISNYNRNDKTTAFNCFVMGTIDDSLAGIMQCLTESARTLQTGGGIGMDFSTIRPKGDEVVGVSGTASGPVSFMDMWDSMCRTIMSAGQRRGAMMGTLRIDHPDIEEFIHAKQDKTRLRNFNVSVLVTDGFMRAVSKREPFALRFNGRVYREVDAYSLWNTITENTYNFAEPGVIFIDQVNSRNPWSAHETISATNPCGEQPLPPYGACLLGSMVLTKYVKNAFEIGKCSLDTSALWEDTRHAFKFLDSVIDNTYYPLPEQEREAKEKRRVGLGVTGFADMLAMLGVRYGSDEAVNYAASIGTLLSNATKEASEELAKDSGRDPHNTHRTSIAPTGTISMLAGNVSSGIEPIFSLEHSRVMLLSKGKEQVNLQDYAYHSFNSRSHGTGVYEFDACFETTDKLTPYQHLRIQAEFQKYIDSAVSKTINVPKDYPFEKFKNVYIDAFKMGCKGCTTYRPNDVTGAVIEDMTVTEQRPPDIFIDAMTVPEPQLLEVPTTYSRPTILYGKTIKIKQVSNPNAIYITINFKNDKPWEVFLNTKDAKLAEHLHVSARLISAVLRKGDYAFMLEELNAVHGTEGGVWHEGVHYNSVFGVIAQYLEVKDSPTFADVAAAPCPVCHKRTLVKKEGCEECLACGYQRC
jgi:ribonucleoside-diphosphate reductase alpha chain